MFVLVKQSAENWYLGGITYLRIADGTFLYLATVMDLCSRRLVGWAVDDQTRTELVVDALHAAQRTRGSLAGAVFHSDHGAQYGAWAFVDACRCACRKCRPRRSGSVVVLIEDAAQSLSSADVESGGGCLMGGWLWQWLYWSGVGDALVGPVVL